MEILSALIGALLLYILQERIYEKYWNKNLSLDLSISKDSAIEGEELTLQEVITNRKFLPLPILQVKFMTSRYLEFQDMDNSRVSDHYYRNDMVSIMMYQRLTKSYTFLCTKRGYYTINRMDVVSANLFKTHEQVEMYDLNITLYVYPKPVDFIKFNAVFSKMIGTVLTKRFINEDPFEFCNIREYQTYDNLKTINWKASAKTGSLKVNVHDYTSSQQVRILINTEPETIWKYDDLNEESIRIASALAQTFISQGVPVALYSNGKDIITKETVEVPAGSGGNHYKTIQEALARIDMKLEPTAFLQGIQDRGDIYDSNDFLIIISYNQKQELQDYLMEQCHKKQELAWIIPRNKEIEIKVCDELSEYIIPWELED